MKTKVIPAVLLLLFIGALPAWSIIHRSRLPDFAAYLKEAGLTKLYRTELRTLCFEYNDPAACLEATRILRREREEVRATALLDSITYRDRRAEFTSELLRARVLAEIQQYKQALETAEAIIEEMPAKDLLVEAVLVKAQCLYHLGQVEEALMNLRSIRHFVPEGRDPTLPLYLGFCEEAGGNLEDAERLFEEAEAGGSPDAALGLLRLALKQGDLDRFYFIADGGPLWNL